MDATVPDYLNLALPTFLGLLLLITAFDVVTATVAAIAKSTFSTDYLMTYLRSHVLQRVFVIFAMEVIGKGIPSLGIPAIGAAADFAAVSLGLYVVETIGSIKSTIDGSTAPAGPPPKP